MSQNPPRTLHLVFNAVREDSRVLKIAYSLGNAGWDVLLVGNAPTVHPDQFEIGYAKIKRVGLKPIVNNGLLKKIGRRIRWAKNKIRYFLLIPSSTAKFTGIPNLNRAVKELKPIALEFAPKIIHAHDYTILPVAGRLKEYLRKANIECEIIYDAHEYVPGVAHLKPELAAAYTAEERKWSKEAAAVLSVSEGMSELLIKHLEINYQPRIVANDPLISGQSKATRNIRNETGLQNGEKIMVYSGAVAPQRGLKTAVDALSKMPDVHLVIIANPENKTIAELISTSGSSRSRIHVLPYVPNNELVDYLASADIGLIPIWHKLNHEISLITKFGEYMQANLPILVSDVKTMSQEVRRLGNGEVFVAEDVSDFVRAANLIFADKSKYQSAYTPTVLAERSWEKQGEILVSIYNDIAQVSPTPKSPAIFKLTEPVRQ
jgi:glycosyltransferase involved in cell wall biosynthesis